MSLREMTLLAALCLIAAIASGTVVTIVTSASPKEPVQRTAAFIRTVPVQTSALPSPRLQPAFMDTAETGITPLRDSEPFGFVPRHATNELFAALVQERIAGDAAAAWASATTVAPPPQSIVRLPGDRAPELPWQSGLAARDTYSLSERLQEIGPSAQQRLNAKFIAAKAPWQPAEIALVAIKDEKVLELHARPAAGSWTFIHRYPVLAASGASGPKLRRGDKQVPEGVYGITFLNPNSRYHVALRVSYPNAFDRQMGRRDGRRDLGGDIMIHGKAASVGCLAIGDAAAEELFVLAAATGLKNIKLVIAPTDFRSKTIPARQDGQPSWLPELYLEVASAMSPFKAPPPSGGLLSFFSN